MARELDVPLHEIMIRGSRWRRLLTSARETIRLIRRERPQVVFASNPSLFLSLLLLATRRPLGFRFVTDAHYGGIVAVNGGRPVQWLLNAVNARADVVIVTTEGHAQVVRRLGGNPFVFPDPLPELPSPNGRPSVLGDARKSVLFVCSYDRDEPFEDVFAAARLLEREGFEVFASGRYARVGLTPEQVPHVRLLGYVERATYDGLLHHSDVVLDLTTWEDCLVCGAYEAMAAGKPCVLSRTDSLTSLFTSGTVFTTHSPEAIADAVRTAYADRQRLASSIQPWVVAHRRATAERASRLRTAVGLGTSEA